jgi:hypothetical protein
MPRKTAEPAPQHRQSAFAVPTPPDMHKSHAAAAAAPTQQLAQTPVAATCDRAGSMQKPGRQRSASSELPGEASDQTPGSWQRSGSGSGIEAEAGTPAGSGTVEQARELQQLRRQVAELRQRVECQGSAEAKLRGELEGARRVAESAQQEAEEARRRVCTSTAPCHCNMQKQIARV